MLFQNNAISEKRRKVLQLSRYKMYLFKKKKNTARAYFSHIVFIYLPTSNMLQIDNFNAIPDFISILEVILPH